MPIGRRNRNVAAADRRHHVSPNPYAYRRRQQRQQQPTIPHTISNPTIPTAVQIRMLAITHLTFLFSYFRVERDAATVAEPSLPDGAQYELFPFECMLAKQRKRKL